MPEKLRIFVSGKEGELDNERATAIKLINSLGFLNVSSENRSASSESIENEYLSEVSTSDFYIGIFGYRHSEPTINEFTTARANNVCTLVFEKELREGEERDDKLKEFLTKLKDSKSGLVVPKYTNVVDLETKIRDALSYYLTKKFRENKKLEIEEAKINYEKKRDQITRALQSVPISTKILEFFGVQFSDQFGKAEFIDFKFPSTLEAVKTHLVTAKIKGSTKNGFLDLAIKDHDNTYYWFPDPLSYDSSYDNGRLCLDNEEYRSSWEFSIPLKKGKFVAIMGLYENNFKDRKCVNYEKREFTVY